MIASSTATKSLVRTFQNLFLLTSQLCTKESNHESQELLSDPNKWTKKCYARNERGESVVSDDESATCWCLYGALNKCYVRGEQWVEAHKRIENALRIETGSERIVAFNDSEATTHEDLMRVLERADV